MPDVDMPEGFVPFNPEGHELNERLAEKSNAARAALNAREAAATAYAASREEAR